MPRGRLLLHQLNIPLQRRNCCSQRYAIYLRVNKIIKDNRNRKSDNTTVNRLPPYVGSNPSCRIEFYYTLYEKESLLCINTYGSSILPCSYCRCYLYAVSEYSSC